MEKIDSVEGAGGLIYWSDFASENIEAEIGADFAIVVHLGGDSYNIAFLQAKRVKYDFDADIYHYVKSKNKTQNDILVEHEIKHPCGVAPDATDLTIFGRWCFYIFWHEVNDYGDLLPPTVRSAHAVKETMVGRRCSSLENALEFAAFVALFLADAGANVGYLAEAAEMPALFKDHPPSSLMFLDPPANGLAPEDKAELLRNLGYTLASPLSGRIRRPPEPDGDTPGMAGP